MADGDRVTAEGGSGRQQTAAGGEELGDSAHMERRHPKMFCQRPWLLLLLLSARLPGRGAAEQQSAVLDRAPRQATSLDEQLQLLLSGGTAAPPAPTTAEPDSDSDSEPTPEPEPTPQSGPPPRAHTGGKHHDAGRHRHAHSHHSHVHSAGHHEEQGTAADAGRQDGYQSDHDHHGGHPGGYRHDKMHRHDQPHDRHYSTDMHHYDPSPQHSRRGHHMDSGSYYTDNQMHHHSGDKKHHGRGGTMHHRYYTKPPGMSAAHPGESRPYHHTSASGAHTAGGHGMGGGYQHDYPGQGSPKGSYMTPHTGYSTGWGAGADDPSVEAYMAGYRLGMETRTETGLKSRPYGMGMNAREHHGGAHLSGDAWAHSQGSGPYSNTGGWGGNMAGYPAAGLGNYPGPGVRMDDSDPMTDAFMSGYAAALGSTVVMGAPGGGFDSRHGAGYGDPYLTSGSHRSDGGRQQHRHHHPDQRQMYPDGGSRRHRAPAGPRHHGRQGGGANTTASEVAGDQRRLAGSPGRRSGGVELLPYVIEAVSDVYETRYYPSSSWVCAAGFGADGSCAGEERACLRQLERYQSGQNTAGAVLAPTGPLLLLQEAPASDTSGPAPESTLCSLLPAADRDEPPPPLRGDVFLLEQPNTRLYARPLGRQRPELEDSAGWQEAGRRLLQQLRRDGAELDDSQVLAFLYPPPGGGREVAVIKRQAGPTVTDTAS